MSALLMGRAFYVPLDLSSKLVLLALADHANDDGAGARPGLKRLESKTGTHRATVQRALQHLESHGLIVARGYRKGGRGFATNWVINTGLVRLWADLYEDDLAEWETVAESDCTIRKGCHLGHETVASEVQNSRIIARPQPSGTTINQNEDSNLKPEGGLVAEFKRRIAQ